MNRPVSQSERASNSDDADERVRGLVQAAQTAERVREVAQAGCVGRRDVAAVELAITWSAPTSA